MPLRNPPPEFPIITFASPNKGDLGLIEFWNTELASYVPLDIGAPHPNSRLYPGFTLGIQQALAGDEKWVKRVWVTPATNEDWFNYQIKYSAQADAYPIFIRTYQEAKATYTPRVKGSQLATLYKLVLTNPGVGYTPGSFPAVSFDYGPATAHGVVNADGTLAELVIDSGGDGYSVPPIVTVEDPPVGLEIGEVATGIAYVQPSGAILVQEEANQYPTGSEFYAQYFQVARVYETIPGPVLVEQKFDDRGILHTIETNLVLSGAATPIADEVTDQSTAPRDSVVDKFTNDVAQKFFEDKSFAKEIPDVVPLRFRVAIPTVTEGDREAGIAALPTLVAGDLRRSEHQFTEFLKDVSVTRRDAVSLPVSLISYKLTGDRQVETVTETLDAGLQTLSPDALLVEGDVQNLGNNQSLMMEGTVPDVFARQAFTVAIPDPIPLRFRTLIPTATSANDEAGIAVMPVLGLGEVEASETQKDEFVKRVSVTDRAGTTLPVTLIGYKLTPEKQIETITETLDDTLQVLSGISATTYEAEVQNIGNGMSILVDGEVPDVFGANVFEETIPDIIPVEFRPVVPTATIEVNTAGTAADPTLGVGDLSITETQVNEFVKRTRTVTRAGVSLPVSLVDRDTDKDKQVVTRTRTLEDLGDSTAVPDALTDVKVTNLGNNLELEEINAVPEVFDRADYSITIPDPIPARFRVVAPTATTALESAGVASMPTLGTGDLEASSRQINEFVKRDSVSTRAGTSLPVSLVSYKLTADKQIETVTETLDTGLQTITGVSALTVEAEVQNLGNNTSLLTDGEVPSVFGAEVFAEEIPDPIPQRFRVVAPTATIGVTTAGTASDPTLGTGDLSIRETQVDEFRVRTETVTRSAVSLPVSLVSYKYTKDKQVETVTETLATGLQTITGASTTIDNEVQNLGNNTSLKTVGTVPALFTNAEYAVEIPITIPLKFRPAVPIATVSLDSAGTAAAPTLGVGDFSIKDEQIDAFNKRTTTQSIGSISLPVSLVSYRYRKAEGRIETITETLATGLQTLSAITALTTEGDVQNLGNGTSLKTEATIASLFLRKSSGQAIEDIIPREFRGIVPTFTTDQDVAGAINDPPTLGTGDLEVVETQLNDYVKRVRRITRDPGVTLPVTLTGGKKIVEKYGVQLIADRVVTLAATGTTSIPSGPDVIEAEINEIGSGMEVLTTLVADGGVWPLLSSRLWDENMRVEYDETSQVVGAGDPEDADPGGNFGWVSEVKAINQWQSRRINSSKPAPPYVDEVSALISYDYRPFKFPGLLYRASAGYYVRETRAELCQHKIKTWWIKSVVTPVIPIDEIITDSPVISSLNNTTTLQYAGEVLHDDLTTFGALFYPATTPSYTEYALGVATGSTTTEGFVTLVNPGTGYVMGDTLTITGDGNSATLVVGAIGVAGSILYTTTSSGTFVVTGGAYASTGGTGTGAQFYITVVAVPNFVSGTAWKGTERIIGASVTPEREKDLWKIQTRSVVMR